MTDAAVRASAAKTRPTQQVVEVSAGVARSADAVVVTCDSGAIVGEAVAALLRDPAVDRVIIVDHRSRGAHREVVAAIEREQSDRVEVVWQDRNPGFAAGVNEGLRRVRRPFAAIVNPDCVVDRGAVESLVDAMNAAPRAGIAGGTVLDRNGREQAGSRRELPRRRDAFLRRLGLRGPRWDFNHAGRPMPAGPVEVPAVSGALMLVRSSAISAVGPLDERFVLHFEDLEWCARMRRSGFAVLFVPEASGRHLKGTSAARRPLFACYHKHRSLLLFDRLQAGSRWQRHSHALFAIAVWSGFLVAAPIELIASRVRRR